ncbi:hypothetical protein LX32DRAFT_642194 [Colletotrichum zoysiae]|uniref:Uncharacterized protein n=1 Tax=Colletotrichum zoysiae TaxID=1216348 RepID=A0AAD9HBY5_9PEZI|nr:hypothetical protein LX32DRAFT_642194 [Colletotrichum zoysiae]
MLDKRATALEEILPGIMVHMLPSNILIAAQTCATGPSGHPECTSLPPRSPHAASSEAR